ncbi:unnamed protein product [Darwinula stevensoni]|uniref:Uncharacterized protein n=1 Tax=Darwinula stevensoni TaxID=69355 RepID=A0A7R8XET5_9CRUS|nr:unnamed protein product [Darwinula stevensoni]CAG0889996.1 unnamed protein product [Darwinula stevensoni]
MLSSKNSVQRVATRRAFEAAHRKPKTKFSQNEQEEMRRKTQMYSEKYRADRVAGKRIAYEDSSIMIDTSSASYLADEQSSTSSDQSKTFCDSPHPDQVVKETLQKLPRKLGGRNILKNLAKEPRKPVDSKSPLPVPIPTPSACVVSPPPFCILLLVLFKALNKEGPSASATSTGKTDEKESEASNGQTQTILEPDAKSDRSEKENREVMRHRTWREKSRADRRSIPIINGIIPPEEVPLAQEESAERAEASVPKDIPEEEVEPVVQEITMGVRDATTAMSLHVSHLTPSLYQNSQVSSVSPEMRRTPMGENPLPLANQTVGILPSIQEHTYEPHSASVTLGSQLLDPSQLQAFIASSIQDVLQREFQKFLTVQTELPGVSSSRKRSMDARESKERSPAKDLTQSSPKRLKPSDSIHEKTTSVEADDEESSDEDLLPKQPSLSNKSSDGTRSSHMCQDTQQISLERTTVADVSMKHRDMSSVKQTKTVSESLTGKCKQHFSTAKEITLCYEDDTDETGYAHLGDAGGDSSCLNHDSFISPAAQSQHKTTKKSFSQSAKTSSSHSVSRNKSGTTRKSHSSSQYDSSFRARSSSRVSLEADASLRCGQEKHGNHDIGSDVCETDLSEMQTSGYSLRRRSLSVNQKESPKKVKSPRCKSGKRKSSKKSTAIVPTTRRSLQYEQQVEADGDENSLEDMQTGLPSCSTSATPQPCNFTVVLGIDDFPLSTPKRSARTKRVHASFFAQSALGGKISKRGTGLIQTHQDSPVTSRTVSSLALSLDTSDFASVTNRTEEDTQDGNSTDCTSKEGTMRSNSRSLRSLQSINYTNMFSPFTGKVKERAEKRQNGTLKSQGTKQARAVPVSSSRRGRKAQESQTKRRKPRSPSQSHYTSKKKTPPGEKERTCPPSETSRSTFYSRYTGEDSGLDIATISNRFSASQTSRSAEDSAKGKTRKGNDSQKSQTKKTEKREKKKASPSLQKSSKKRTIQGERSADSPNEGSRSTLCGPSSGGDLDLNHVTISNRFSTSLTSSLPSHAPDGTHARTSRKSNSRVLTPSRSMEGSSLDDDEDETYQPGESTLSEDGTLSGFHESEDMEVEDSLATSLARRRASSRCFNADDDIDLSEYPQVVRDCFKREGRYQRLKFDQDRLFRLGYRADIRFVGTKSILKLTKLHRSQRFQEFIEFDRDNLYYHSWKYMKEERKKRSAAKKSQQGQRRSSKKPTETEPSVGPDRREPKEGDPYVINYFRPLDGVVFSHFFINPGCSKPPRPIRPGNTVIGIVEVGIVEVTMNNDMPRTLHPNDVVIMKHGTEYSLKNVGESQAVLLMGTMDFREMMKSFMRDVGIKEIRKMLQDVQAEEEDCYFPGRDE